MPRRKGNGRWDIIIKGKIFRRPIQAHEKAPELFTHRGTGGDDQEVGVDIAGREREISVTRPLRMKEAIGLGND